jgi:TIR domain
MRILTLYENNDREARKALDRYLQRLSVGGIPTELWDADKILPGDSIEQAVKDQIAGADLILLLATQDFWASKTCYDRAQEALRQCRERPEKKIAAVALRPNSMEDTLFEGIALFPGAGRCISHYADPDQGYWDVYQGIRAWLNPAYHYRRRPKINYLRALVAGASLLLLWCFFVVLLPVFYPQTGLRIVPMPERSGSDRLVYTLYKLDEAPQQDLTLSFFVTRDEALKFGTLLYAQLDKAGNDAWASGRTQWIVPHENFMDSTQTHYFSQCVGADFAQNDGGAYQFMVEFGQALNGKDISGFAGRIDCNPGYCSLSEAACYPITPFQTFHCLYFRKTRLSAAISIFLLLSVLLGAVFTVKKLSFYGTP